MDLPTHLPWRPGDFDISSSPLDIRWQQHLKWTLLVHCCGGDITEDYPDSETRAVMEALSAWGNGEDVAGLDDPLWQNEIGKEILLAHMETWSGKTSRAQSGSPKNWEISSESLESWAKWCESSQDSEGSLQEDDQGHLVTAQSLTPSEELSTPSSTTS